MKKTDIIVCISIAILAAIFAVFFTRAFFGDPNEAKATIEHVEAISDIVRQPDPLIFNRSAIDPTIEVCIGELDPDSPEAAACQNQFEIVEPTPCDPTTDPTCVPVDDGEN